MKERTRESIKLSVTYCVYFQLIVKVSIYFSNRIFFISDVPNILQNSIEGSNYFKVLFLQTVQNDKLVLPLIMNK